MKIAGGVIPHVDAVVCGGENGADIRRQARKVAVVGVEGAEDVSVGAILTDPVALHAQVALSLIGGGEVPLGVIGKGGDRAGGVHIEEHVTEAVCDVSLMAVG